MKHNFFDVIDDNNKFLVFQVSQLACVISCIVNVSGKLEEEKETWYDQRYKSVCVAEGQGGRVEGKRHWIGYKRMNILELNSNNIAFQDNVKKITEFDFECDRRHDFIGG